MSEAEFHDALDPRKILAGRRTAGSARPEEVEAMLAEDEEALAANRKVLAAARAGVEAALAALEGDFSRI